MTQWIDLGQDHRMSFTVWAPDRALNPQYKDAPDVARWGLLVEHKQPDGSECMSGLTFDGPGQREIDPRSPKWTVECMEPLTLSPSILCMRCGDHGFIRSGKWVAA